MRTRLSICLRKRRFETEKDAWLYAAGTVLTLRPYRCDRCGHVHLTSRTKGKRVLRPIDGGHLPDCADPGL